MQGFSGLTIAVAVLAPLTALAAFAELPPIRRTAAALLVGLAYLVASYFAQGAFKEMIQALFVLAFVLALREATRSWRELPLRFVPAALIAVGSVYAYSFPGLIWLRGDVVIWLAVRAGVSSHRAAALLALPRPPDRPSPELGRMIDFHSFETFDPNGPGLGNLFGQVSPFRRSGSGPPATSASPPATAPCRRFGYYLGAAFASVLLALGICRAGAARERAARRSSALSRSPISRPASAARPTPRPRRSRSPPRSLALTILLPWPGEPMPASSRGWRGEGTAPEDA